MAAVERILAFFQVIAVVSFDNAEDTDVISSYIYIRVTAVKDFHTEFFQIAEEFVAITALHFVIAGSVIARVVTDGLFYQCQGIFCTAGTAYHIAAEDDYIRFGFVYIVDKSGLIGASVYTVVQI